MSDDVVGQLHEWIMEQPCALERHEPFVIAENSSVLGAIIYGYVRTSSFHLDGCGGRTDVHDLYSVLWACILRTSGAASARLISEAGFTGIEQEIYARWVVFEQLGDFCDKASPRERLLAHTSRAFHMLDEVLEWDTIKYPAASWSDNEEEFANSLNEAGKLKDFGEMCGKREFPHWYYAKSHKGRISVAVFPMEKMMALRRALFPYQPVAVDTATGASILTGGLKNAISKRTISTGIRYIHAIENGPDKWQWIGAGSDALEIAVVAIPLESHCVFLGAQTLVVVEADCGLRAFESERTKFLERRVKENAVFAADYCFEWNSKIDGGRFEDLIYALLEREPGIIWVRQSSPTQERDGGRDFMAKWIVPIGQSCGEVVESDKNEIPTPSRILNVVIQVKASQSSVGKSKVRDIRDTVENFEADGYFLVAFPQPSAALVEHLIGLSRHRVWSSWWDRAQIESRLRKNLDLVARFGDLVSMEERRL